MIDLKKELILIGLVAVNSYLINSSEAATNDSEVIGDIALAKTLRDYYNNLTMPYVVSNYDDNVSISLPSDESIFNEIQAYLEELQNNNSNNTQSK